MLDGDTGFIVPVNDDVQFAERVLQLVENEKKREKMSQNGWAFVRDKFHYNNLAANVDSLYKVLLMKSKENEA